MDEHDETPSFSLFSMKRIVGKVDDLPYMYRTLCKQRWQYLLMGKFADIPPLHLNEWTLNFITTDDSQISNGWVL